jgi:hypothetical protein
MVHIARRVSTSMLRSLLRTAACAALSSSTSGGLAGRPRPRGGGASPAGSASLPPFSAGPRLADGARFCLGHPPLSIFSELVPTQSSRRLGPDFVPPSQPSRAARTLLMSECCIQSQWLPGRIGVHSISPMIRSLLIHFRSGFGQHLR